MRHVQFPEQTPQTLLPFTSRISPLASTVGEFNRDWAIRVGLVKDEAEDSWLACCAPHLAAARMYPQAAVADLTLVSGYLTWLFALDDQMDAREAGNQSSAVLTRVALAVREAHRGIIEQSGDPLVDAFAELHRRSQARAPAAYLRRQLAHLSETFEAFGTEIRHRTAAIPPTSAEYTEQRRRTSCARIFADFTELVTGIEPPTVLCGVEYQTVIDCAADIGAWDNDLVSLCREIPQGEVNNLVLVLSTAEDLNLTQASNQVAERIRQRTGDYLSAEQRLLARLEAADITEPARLRYRHLVHALRDVLSGVITWNHTDTLRFTSVHTGRIHTTIMHDMDR